MTRTLLRPTLFLFLAGSSTGGLGLGAGTVRAADLPDSSLTPGEARVVTKPEVCRRGSSKDARHVTQGMKSQVFQRYGIPGGNHTGLCGGPHGCEVDHLISLELGGANSIKNLWPQPFDG
jgi:hypothetical protein